MSIPNFPSDQGQGAQIAFLKDYADRNGIRTAKAVLSSAAAATPVVLVPDNEVASNQKVAIVGWKFKVNGATLWATVANVYVRTTTGNTNILDIAVAALTANAYQESGDMTNITPDSSYELGDGAPDAGEGLELVADVNGTGSDLHVTLFYKVING